MKNSQLILTLTVLIFQINPSSSALLKHSKEKPKEKHCLAKRDLFYYAHANYVRNDNELFPYDINCMLTIQGDGGDAEPGDIYFGTPQGLFFRTNGQNNRRNGNYDTKKIDPISNSVHLMCEHQEGSIILTTYDNQLYYVDNNHNVKEDFDVADPITTMITIKKDGFQSQAGDVYFGTTKGVYLRRKGSTAYKIRGMNGYVSIIQEHLDGTVHVVLDKNKDENAQRDKDAIIRSLNEKLGKLEQEKLALNETVNKLVDEKLTLETDRKNMNQTINTCQNERMLVYKTLQISNEQVRKLDEEKRNVKETINGCNNDKARLENENRRLEDNIKMNRTTSDREDYLDKITKSNLKIRELAEEVKRYKELSRAC